MVAVRNTAKYSPAVFERGPEQRHDWEICLELASRLYGSGNPVLRLPGRLGKGALSKLGPEAIYELGLRSGPYGLRKLGLDPAPLVLGLVIAPLFEMSLRQSLIMSNGDWMIFAQRPIALVLLSAFVLLLGGAANWSARCLGLKPDRV